MNSAQKLLPNREPLGPQEQGMAAAHVLESLLPPAQDAAQAGLEGCPLLLSGTLLSAQAQPEAGLAAGVLDLSQPFRATLARRREALFLELRQQRDGDWQRMRFESPAPAKAAISVAALPPLDSPAQPIGWSQMLALLAVLRWAMQAGDGEHWELPPPSQSARERALEWVRAHPHPTLVVQPVDAAWRISSPRSALLTRALLIAASLEALLLIGVIASIAELLPFGWLRAFAAALVLVVPTVVILILWRRAYRRQTLDLADDHMLTTKGALVAPAATEQLIAMPSDARQARSQGHGRLYLRDGQGDERELVTGIGAQSCDWLAQAVAAFYGLPDEQVALLDDAHRWLAWDHVEARGVVSVQSRDGQPLELELSELRWVEAAAQDDTLELRLDLANGSRFWVFGPRHQGEVAQELTRWECAQRRMKQDQAASLVDSSAEQSTLSACFELSHQEMRRVWGQVRGVADRCRMQRLASAAQHDWKRELVAKCPEPLRLVPQAKLVELLLPARRRSFVLLFMGLVGLPGVLFMVGLLANELELGDGLRVLLAIAVLLAFFVVFTMVYLNYEPERWVLVGPQALVDRPFALLSRQSYRCLTVHRLHHVVQLSSAWQTSSHRFDDEAQARFVEEVIAAWSGLARPAQP